MNQKVFFDETKVDELEQSFKEFSQNNFIKLPVTKVN